MRKTSSLPNSAPDSSDFPYGGIVDQDELVQGTPVIEATYSDFVQSLWQFFRVTSTAPNGLAENTTNGFQLFDAIEKFLNPVGTIKIWPATVIPSGWLSCDGSILLRADYPELFDLIGTTYGTTLSTNFKLPNLSDRFPLKKGTTYPTLGVTGGEINHTLTDAEMPSHHHYNGIADNEIVNYVYGGTTEEMPGYATRTNYVENSARTYQGLTSETGGDDPHNNMPPYLVLNFIIKVKYGKNL